MEETIPLLSPQSIEGEVWILLPIRYTDRGAVPKKIQLSLGPGNGTIVHVFKSNEAICHGYYGQIYVFRVTLNAEEMSNCFIEIWDDDVVRQNWNTYETVKRSLPTCIKLIHIPPNKENEFWNDFHSVADIVFNYRGVLFRPKLRDRDTIIIENDEQEKSIKDRIARMVVESSASDLLLDGMSTICEVSLFNFKLGRKSALMYGLDASPFRLALQSSGSASDSFAKALEEVRETYITSSFFSKFNVRIHEKLKRAFDRRFLNLSNLTSRKSPVYLVYDDRKNELQTVEHNYFDIEEHCHADLIAGRISWIYENVGFPTTNEGLQEAVRRNWIKYQCLQGQDDEFNIFRSICFAPPSNFDERYHIGFVALSLQILLCIGITIDSVNQWTDTSLEDIWDTIISLEYELEDVLIVIISTLTFAFILQRLRKTINSFHRFYRNIKEVCIIPQAIIALDFTSNVLVGTWMAMITPFFLLQSEDIQTVVLNSFALTIFIELDDLANVFESDEAYLLQEDANGIQRTRMDPRWMERNLDAWGRLKKWGVVKREIGFQWTGYKALQMLVKFLFIPFYESYKIVESLLRMCCSCVVERKKQPVSIAMRSRLIDLLPATISGNSLWDVYWHHNKERKCVKMVVSSSHILLCFDSIEDMSDVLQSVELSYLQKIHLGKVSHTLQNATCPHNVHFSIIHRMGKRSEEIVFETRNADDRMKIILDIIDKMAVLGINPMNGLENTKLAVFLNMDQDKILELRFEEDLSRSNEGSVSVTLPQSQEHKKSALRTNNIIERSDHEEDPILKRSDDE